MPYYLVMLRDGAKQILAANNPQEALIQAEVVWPDTVGVVDLDQPDVAQVLLDHLYPAEQGECGSDGGLVSWRVGEWVSDGCRVSCDESPESASLVPRPSSLATSGTLGTLTIYTDGSAIGNPGPAGWAYVRSDGQEDSGYIGCVGNNVAELTAVWQALQSCPEGARVQIVTDSRNVMGWLAGGWKRKDPHICRTIEAIAETTQSRNLRVTYRQIAGHSNHPDNERAHALAEGAARQT
jgi:ribonuclease HI